MTLKSLLASAAMASLLPVLALADIAANKATAIKALTATIGKGDIAAVDQYFDPAYIQHNPDIANGTEALKDLITTLHASGKFKSDTVRVIADGDLVAFQGRYEGFGPTPMVAFDVFRMKEPPRSPIWTRPTPTRRWSPNLSPRR